MDHLDLLLASAVALGASARAVRGALALRLPAVALACWVALELVGFATAGHRGPEVLRRAALSGVIGALLVERGRVRFVLLSLSYGGAVMLLRHLVPDISRGAWRVLLQAPAAALFSYALWVALVRRPALSPGRTIGLAVALGDGVAAAFDLWSFWPSVRVVSAFEWAVAAWVVATAPP